MTSETTILNAFKKLLKWLAASFLVFGLLASLISLGVHVFYEIKDRPKVESELNGVKLGGNRPLEPRALEVEFFPMEEVLHEKVKIH